MKEKSETNHQTTLGSLFLKFLRFGGLAWGGPVAQIGVLKDELVEKEKWITNERFNRVLGVYQALPGPEATELCIYFGQRKRGRVGGLVAGLGFVLPGFVLMMLFTWAYVVAGPFEGRALTALAAVQIAAVALVARGAWKIGTKALPDKTTVGIAISAAIATAAGVHFAIVLVGAGATLEISRRSRILGVVLLAAILASAIALGFDGQTPPGTTAQSNQKPEAPHAGDATIVDTAVSGLQAGSLTFGGAYTVIPFLRHDAVDKGGWLTDTQLLQGLALGSVLPAPLIIFATFVGWMAAGPWGAVAMTVTIFLPAFVIPLAGHNSLERLVDDPRVHDFLDGIMAGVVGLIGFTVIGLATFLVEDLRLALILALSAFALFQWSAPWVIPAVMLGAALFGAATG